jgi:hypothetical protein
LFTQCTKLSEKSSRTSELSAAVPKDSSVPVRSLPYMTWHRKKRSNISTYHRMPILGFAV